jgi:threonine dehydrogenase-like Zn-dependent dehydrogenase
VRRHGIEHYLDMAASGEVDLVKMVTHEFGLSEWQDAFAALGDQATSGAIKVTIDPSR